MALQSNIMWQLSGDYGVWRVRASEEVLDQVKSEEVLKTEHVHRSIRSISEDHCLAEYLPKQNLTPNQTAIIRGDKRRGAGLKDK